MLKKKPKWLYIRTIFGDTMTFSIVAVDRDVKEIGFGIASCTWNAGMVGTAKAELGALCSQAQGYFPFHSVLYENLRNDKSLEDIFEEFRKMDENIENRQVGMVSFNGDVFSFTGNKNGEYAGHILGDDYACQGNILTGHDVLEKMAEAFESTKGMLAERLYAALQAGDDIGGDKRGKMSARVLVKKKGYGLEDTYIDLTVEDLDEPVQEIGRLLRVRRKILNAYLKQRAVEDAEGDEKISALKDMVEYLSDKVDRTVIDYHEFVAQTSLELGLSEIAIKSFRNWIEIGPKLVDSLKKMRDAGELNSELYESILS